MSAVSVRKIHIIGAGGVGMSGLALLSARMGIAVTASDRNDSAYLQKLAEKGIATWVGSQPLRIPLDAQIYYSTAIKAGDPERRFATEHNLPCEPRHALLKFITEHYFTIAIGGCHGKTTTSAWIAHLLILAGYDPTALIGGTVPQWNSNYREGKGQMQSLPLLVIEGDESDRSFLAIASKVSLITNIDLDHTDVHASLEALEQDFTEFATGAQKRGGWIHVSKECGPGFAALPAADERELWAKVIVLPEEHAVAFAGKKYPVGLAGRHNLMNATLVLQLALKLGIDENLIAESLATFSGVNRRMQKLAEFGALGLSVIDDYAHHPHEVQATLAALAPQYDRLIIFWEPHRLSRFSHFHQDFADVLVPYSEENTLMSLPLYASGDKPEEYPQAEEFFQRFKQSPFRHIASTKEFDLTALKLDGRKTAAVFMGAGSSSDYAKAFVDYVTGQTAR